MSLQVETETKLKTLIQTEIEGDLIIGLFDNFKERPGMKTGWGFSCFVKRENNINILFDTGANGKDLLFNMGKMDVGPKEIDLIFLSHIHSDHTGGLMSVLEKNSDLTVVIPKSFDINFKEKVKEKGAKIKEVESFEKIGEDIFSTGEFKHSTKEHSLALKTKKGIVVITGCAHPGILNIIERVKHNFSEDIYLALGGFHLKGSSQIHLENIVKEFKKNNIKKVAPSHCTGDRAICLFEKKYKNNYIANGAGKIIKL